MQIPRQSRRGQQFERAQCEAEHAEPRAALRAEMSGMATAQRKSNRISDLSGSEHYFDAAVMLVPERLIEFRSLRQRRGMLDDEGRIDLTVLGAAQEVIGPAV